jgi:hypothetical protein
MYIPSEEAVFFQAESELRFARNGVHLAAPMVIRAIHQARRAQDIGGQELSYAEVAAIDRHASERALVQLVI